MRQRDVEHQSLEDLVLPGTLRERVQVPHHLEPVSQLEDGHPRIGGVLDNKLLVILRLETGVLRLDLGDLVQTVDHGVDILGKAGK